MQRRYFEVEIEYTGTKIFKVPVELNQSQGDALAYIAANYETLDYNYNAFNDMTDSKLVAVNYREEKE